MRVLQLVHACQRTGNAFDVLTWTVLPALVVFVAIAIHLRVRYRALFTAERIANATAPGTLVLCTVRERPDDIPEAYGTWPTGRLYTAHATRDGVTLSDRNGVTAFIPRADIDTVEVDHVEFYRALAPAIRLGIGAPASPLPLVPSFRIIPGTFTTTRRVRRIATEFAARLNAHV